MRVYIFSLPQNLYLARKIHDFLNLKGHSVKLFDSDSQFFNFVYKKEEIPDFVVYDYFLFNHNIFNIYNFMKGENCLVPLVFFNDPTLHLETTKFFFKKLLNFIHAENKIEWEKYGQIISETAEIIDLEKTGQNISCQKELSRKTQKTEEKIRISEKETPETQILQRLSGLNLAVFKKLFSNLNNCVPLKELKISDELNRTLQDATVFCTISKIRKTIKTAGENSFEIIKNPDGYTMISRF